MQSMNTGAKSSQEEQLIFRLFRKINYSGTKVDFRVFFHQSLIFSIIFYSYFFLFETVDSRNITILTINCFCCFFFYYLSVVCSSVIRRYNCSFGES